MAIHDRLGRRHAPPRRGLADSPATIEPLEPRLLLSGAIGPALAQTIVPGDTDGKGISTLVDAGGAPAEDLVSLEWNGRQVLAKAGEWIVRLADAGATAATHTGGPAVPGGKPTAIEPLDLPGFALLKAPGVTAEQMTKWARDLPGIVYAEPNFVYTAIQDPAVVFPSDTSFDSLWGLHNTGQSGGTVDADIDAPEAWALTTGSSEIVLAVIDTGVDYTHPDLANNIWVNTGEIFGDGIDNDDNGFIDDWFGWDFAYGDNDPMDGAGHGTHVAGTIGATGSNHTGVVGVNWNVRIMSLKFLDDAGYGSTNDAVSAINYATMMRRDYGVNVIATNNSWGGGGYSSVLREAIQAAEAEGILFIAAAGNEHNDNDLMPNYPSSYELDSIISVAATDRNDQLGGFSNYGAVSVDLAAPGVAILSTVAGGAYDTSEGTSMAAPHVTGVVGLLAASDPGATPAELKVAVTTGTDAVPALSGVCATGGRLNAYQALLALSLPGPKLLAISPTDVSPSVDTISIRFTEDILAVSVAAGNFLLRANGVDDVFDTPDDIDMVLDDSALSQPEPSHVHIDLGAPLDTEQYRLTLLGTGANPIRNLEGEPLNGGNDEVHFFQIEPLGPLEPNDMLADATDTGLTAEQHGTAVLSALLGDGYYRHDDVDLFSFEGGNGDLIIADIDAYETGSSLDPILRLFDAVGNQLAVDDDSNGQDSLIQYALPEAGTYVIGVSGYSNFLYDPTVPASGVGSSVGPYQLRLTLTPPPPVTEIRGNHWNDLNGNGLRDAGEPALEGRTSFLDLDNDGVFDGQAGAVVSTDVPRAIYDYMTTISQLNVSGFDNMLIDVNITLDITHTYDGDLAVDLVSPQGTSVTLFAYIGNSGNNFTNTVLDDEAGMSIASGTAPFTGSFRPIEALAAFNGEDPNGMWRLEVYDEAGMDEGTLNGWSISIQTGEPSALTDADGDYTIPVTPGVHIVRAVREPAWTQTFPTDGHILLIALDEVVEGIDFASIASGEIHGSKWDDLNRDATWDADEPALAGVTIFLDTNQDGLLNTGEMSTITDAQGRYSLIDVEPGTYVVAEVVQDGWSQTWPGDPTLFLAEFEDKAGNYESDGFGYEDPPHMPGTNLWHQTQHRAVDSSWSQYYGLDGVWNYSTGAPSIGHLLSPAIPLPSSDEGIFLSFDYFLQTHGTPTVDMAVVEITNDGGQSWRVITFNDGQALADPTDSWAKWVGDISGYAGGEIILRFSFLTFTTEPHDYEGWYVDNVRIAPGGANTVTVSREQIVEGINFGNVRNSAVAGRHIFYNNSAFDGDDASANTSDDGAIATDKGALLPGQTAALANYTGYSRGINGIMVDIITLRGTPTAADFTFKLGNSDNPLEWTPAPAPLTVAVRPGSGVEGADRVTIVWADNAIENQWLQVTVKASAATGLGEPDVFFFGNAIGEVGDSPANANVTATDELLVRNNPRTLLDPAAVHNPYDHNRDRKVDATDELITRTNATTFMTALKLIELPPPPRRRTANRRRPPA